MKMNPSNFLKLPLVLPFPSQPLTCPYNKCYFKLIFIWSVNSYRLTSLFLFVVVVVLFIFALFVCSCAWQGNFLKKAKKPLSHMAPCFPWESQPLCSLHPLPPMSRGGGKVRVGELGQQQPPPPAHQICSPS